jgi:hypothetical protein
MKIEMGESLILSWLRHSKNCQIVQTNWKPSMESWDYYNEILIDEIVIGIQELFINKYGYDLFKKNRSIRQIVQQGEIDVLGIELVKSFFKDIYAVDIAFHENGLNYGSKSETVGRVLKKLVRMACTILYFFDLKEAKIIFASPKVHKSVYDELSIAIKEMSEYINKTWDLNFKFEFICNDDFREKIYDVVVTLSNNVADTSELFMRSVQMYNAMSKNKNRFQIEISKKNKNEGIVINKSIKQENDKVTQNNTDYDEIKIGALVRSTIPELVRDMLIDDTELNRLLQYDYSKKHFDLNYPMLRKIDESISIKENRMVGDYPRYYSQPILKISGSRYLITSEWYDRNKSYYIHWLGIRQA